MLAVLQLQEMIAETTVEIGVADIMIVVTTVVTEVAATVTVVATTEGCVGMFVWCFLSTLIILGYVM